MKKLTRRDAVKALATLAAARSGIAAADGWSDPAEVRHDEDLCLSYQARIEGPFLAVRVKIEPGWHTFAMDNKQRALEKLAGKRSLGIDHPTEITLAGGLASAGPWYQSPPKDFSKPDLRWFSWGFEQQALFVTRVRRGEAGATRIGIRGQTCTDSTCKNIDVSISLPATNAKLDAASQIKLGSLTQVLP
jgi:hypothetical protein